MLAHVDSGALRYSSQPFSASPLGVPLFYLISQMLSWIYVMWMERPSLCDCHVHGTIHGHPRPCGREHWKLQPQCLLYFSQEILNCAMETQHALPPFSDVYKCHDGCRFSSSTLVNIKCSLTLSQMPKSSHQIQAWQLPITTAVFLWWSQRSSPGGSVS